MSVAHVAHPLLVLDVDAEQLDRFRPEEPLPGIGKSSHRSIDSHLSTEEKETFNSASTYYILKSIITPRLPAAPEKE